MVDLNPSDETYIYSTLLWVSEHAKRYNVTLVITFDQPLWDKANQIITSAPLESEIKIRLWGFHTEMSFWGYIGYIMSDSGLHDIFSVIHAEKAVSHMLSGKAISRALRGHDIVNMALQSLIVSEVFDLDIVGEKKQYSQERADNENYKEAQYITEQVSGNQVEGSEKVEQTAEDVDQIDQKTRENEIVHNYVLTNM